MSVSDVRNDYEIIEGVKFMSPSPDMGHGTITSNLIATIGSYVKINKLGICFGDHMDVHFPDGNVFQPDFIFVSSAKAELFLDKRKFTFHGVPDMVAEIFSKSTMKRDLGIKKDVYERNGVREYWIIDPWSENIQVYILRDGKYQLDDVYQNYSDEELSAMTDKERPEVKMEVPVAVLDGFTVKIRNIFGWYFE